jgi:hypothetical protein
MAKHSPGFTPHQFRNIGVFLLGHDAGAGRATVVEGNKAETLPMPRESFLREAGQMHQDQAGGAGKLNGKVAIANPIQAVAIDPLEPQQVGRVMTVNGKRGPRQCSTAQGRNVHPLVDILQSFPVALGHVKIGQQMMGQTDWLGSLQMGITGDERFNMVFGQLQQSCAETAVTVLESAQFAISDRGGCLFPPGHCGSGPCGVFCPHLPPIQ